MLSLRPALGPNLSRQFVSFCCALAITCLAWCGISKPALASQVTETTLSLTSGGSAVSYVAGGTAVTLTATVQAGASALTLGQVNFCDAAAASCTDIHLVGTAQLTGAGTAVLRFRPGAGSHSYMAVFVGTLDGATSSSVAVDLTVGPRPPGLQTTFTVASVAGPDATSMYALTASVGTKGAVSPSGTVSFLNTNNANSPLGTATLLGAGNGFLNVPIPEPTIGGADAPPIVAIGDFNGDGIPDIISAPHGGIAISLGNGDGTFATAQVPNIDSADGINAFGVGDFNSDGITDLLVDDEDTGELTVLLGKGDGTFTVGQSMPFNTQSIAIADFNGDGKLDLALSGSAQTTILLGNGDGTFTAAPNQPQIGSFQVVAADFNGDGKIDLAISTSINATSVLLGNGDGTFTAAPNPPQTPASQLVGADFNGDGKIDLAVSAPDGTISILLGNGDGTFTVASRFPSGLNAPSLAVGDFNADGKSDLAAAGIANFPDHQVVIFTGNGDGTFAAGIDINSPSAQSMAVADFTGSGTSDVSIFGSVILGNLAISTATNNVDLPTGFVVLQADYPGDANDAASSSTNAPSILVPPQPISLSSQPVTLAPGTSATGSFSVTSSGFTGSLDLTCVIPGPNDETPSPLTCSVPPMVNVVSASTTMNLTYSVTAQATTASGQYSAIITATYPPGGVPPASTVAVVMVGGQNYVLTNTGATIASPGATGYSTITISPIGGYTGLVTMSCAVSGGASGAVNPPTCSIPSPISLSGSPVTTTLTLNTQGATSSGVYTVTVTATSAGSSNATTSFTVNVPPAPPGFALSSTGITLAAPGTNGTTTITISPSGGFTGKVALSCVVSGGPMGGADAPMCSVSSPPAIAGTAAVTATLIVSTTAASPSANSHLVTSNQHPSRPSAIGGLAAGMTWLLWFGFPVRRRRIAIAQLGLLLFATLIGTATGCSGSKAATPPANPGTTPGTYMVTVTGTSGSITAITTVSVALN